MCSTVGVSEADPALSWNSVLPELSKIVSKHAVNARLYEEEPA